MQPATAKMNFWESLKANIHAALTPSEFICDRYERRPYETHVLRPGIKMPFTELKPRKRKCVQWQEAPDSAIGKSCAEYVYENSSPAQHQALYHKVTRYRTVCVEGHNSK
ncbi:MAG: hypothetical protein OXU45_03820 [Candidatus Melainabacteria bacterium]|nr:hypothetical protein [Candidatus Melainabacteria bacterium]